MADHDPKKVPDPSAACPRCHYFTQTESVREERRMAAKPAWPHGIDQQKALDILTKAFPKSYGARG